MSMVRLLAEGAGEAVRLAPLLFTLGGTPAHAQLPRAVPAQQAHAGAPQALWPVSGQSAPKLIAEHLELTLGTQGSVARTTLVYRNDTDASLAAHYALPLAGAVSLRGVDDDPATLVDQDDCGASAGSDLAQHEAGPDQAAQDDPADAAQFLEAGEADPTTLQSGMVWLAPGDEVTLIVVRPVQVLARAARRRVVVVLPESPEGQPVPQFSAEVAVDAAEPIVALGSATHGGAVDGLGGSHARLIVPNGRVHEARFFAVELQLGQVHRADSSRWGREDRLPIAAR